MPIKHEVSQGSTEWFKAKTGIPTSSDFGELITPAGEIGWYTPKRGPKKGQEIPAQKVNAYANKLIADIMRGGCVEEHINSPWMERGVIMEAEARDAYVLSTDNIIENVGLITDNNKHFGCSPDALVVGHKKVNGKIIKLNRGLEIKCPSPKVHMGYLLDENIEKKYKPQYQGQMLIGELDGVDMFSYHPDLPHALIPMERDENFIIKLNTALIKFRTLMNEKIERLMEMGVWEINTPHQETQTDVYMAG